jgi:hypothetical protein
VRITTTRFATRTRIVGVLATLVAALGASLGGCVAAGYDGSSGYYDGGVEVGYGVDFYEPYGYDYGGWRRGYRGGPPLRGRDDHGRPDDHGHLDDRGHPDGRPSHSPAYHPAPAGRPMPSIPSSPRGRSGGGGRGNRDGH